jgi:hypothetical protein
VLFSNSSPSYWNLTPIEGADDGGDGLATGGIVAIVVAVVLAAALAGWIVLRRRTAEERE